jgi:hypothetical protein
MRFQVDRGQSRAVSPGQTDRATHLFEEPGALDAVAEVAAGWYRRWMPG